MISGFLGDFSRPVFAGMWSLTLVSPPQVTGTVSFYRSMDGNSCSALATPYERT